jgi:hypothetical protein
MPHQQPEPSPRHPERRARRDPTRTSVRVALWNAVTALAIIAVLFITFYGLASQRDETGGQSAATTPMPAQTTGQGGGSQSDNAK